MVVCFCKAEEFMKRLRTMVPREGETQEALQQRRELAEASCLRFVGCADKIFDGTNIDSIKDELRTYVADETLMPVVKEVIVTTDKFPPDVDWEIYDVPGFDSPINEHRQEALHSIPDADAFLILSSAEGPSFTRDQKTFLKEITRLNFDAMYRSLGSSPTSSILSSPSWSSARLTSWPRRSSSTTASWKTISSRCAQDATC